MDVPDTILLGAHFFLLALPNMHIPIVTTFVLLPLCFHTLVFTSDVCRQHFYSATSLLDVDK